MDSTEIDSFAADFAGGLLACDLCPVCESEVVKGASWRHDRLGLSVEEEQAFDAKLKELTSEHAAVLIEVAFAGLYRTFGQLAVIAAMQRIVPGKPSRGRRWKTYRERLTNAQRECVGIPTGETPAVSVLVAELCDALATSEILHPEDR